MTFYKNSYEIIIPKQQISPKKVEIHLKNPNECEHNVEVGCIKDVCDCYTLVSSEEELLSFILLAENKKQALRMLKQWGKSFYSEEEVFNILMDFSLQGKNSSSGTPHNIVNWFKNYKK